MVKTESTNTWGRKIQDTKTEVVRILNDTEGKIFDNNNLLFALADCEKEGFRALFMPELMNQRTISEKDSYIWRNYWATPSVKIVGKTRLGSRVVVYGHVPNYFSNSANILKALNEGPEKGACHYPKLKFYELLDKEDGVNVFVKDYDLLKKSNSGLMSLEEAFEHPMTIPFIGGEEKTKAYLKQHKAVVGEKIEVYHSEELFDEPFGLLLGVNYKYMNGYLRGDKALFESGKFLGVRY